MGLQKEMKVSQGDLKKLDDMYAAKDKKFGRPTEWGFLVAELRAMRREIEAGTLVVIENGPTLKTWSEWYTWAHNRYHALEDGYDEWIGNDD